MRTLYREQLNATGCGTPNCDHDHSVLYLHGRCHTHGGLSVYYEKATGLLHVECNVCEQPIATIAVASLTANAPDKEV